MSDEPDAPPCVCRNCGRPLRQFQQCLYCAMSNALEAASESPQDVGDEQMEEGFASFAELRLSAKVGRFRLVSRLGQGGMGTVYEAEDTTLERVVALKMIRSQHFASPAEKQRFKREALATAKLDHPHIVPVYETGEQDECPFLTMKLIRGGTLADMMRHGPLPAEKAASILAKVAAALQHAHDHGVLHRDLKPSNILIDKNGHAWLSDFGIARLIHFGDASEMSTLTASGIPMGTPHYMSPEQAAGHSRLIGPASDVWSLGVLLYQMLTGLPPYHGESSLIVMHKVVYEPPPRYPAPSRDQMGLAVLIERCLQKEPSRRLASAGVLAEELERWQRGGKVQAQPVKSWEKGLRWVRERPATAAALVALFAVGVGYWLMPPADRMALGLFAGKASTPPLTPTSVKTTSYHGPINGNPTNLINGSGLSGSGDVLTQTHNSTYKADTMWSAGTFDGGLGGPLGSPALVSSQIVEFDLGASYSLTQSHVWNLNQGAATERAVKDFEIWISPDTTSAFTKLGDYVLKQPPGSTPIPAQVLATAASSVRRVQFRFKTAWSGAANEYIGLSEVRFEGSPVAAPTHGATVTP